MYIIYYQLESGAYRYWGSKYKKIITKPCLPKRIEGPKKRFSYNMYHMFKGYEPSDEGLIKYNNDFTLWCDELESNQIYPIHYKHFWSSYTAVELTFKNLCKGKYEHHKEITIDEYIWFNKCYNSGLLYCEPGTYDCYGYDYSRFYPLILASDDFKIPTKEGKSIILTKMPKLSERKYGLYKVRITCDNNDFRKLFSFSPEHVYTHYSINQAKKYQNKYDVKIDLICDGKPNAYVYEDNDLESSGSIFKVWYDTLNSIKKLYPSNKLVKHLMSSVWGHISKNNKIRVTEEDIILDFMDVGMTPDCKWMIYEEHITEVSTYYELINSKKPYKYNIRLLPFLTSYGRNKISEISRKDLSNVVRINNDGVCFKKDPCLNIPDLEREAKTSGKIEWIHVNKWNIIEPS